MIVEIILVIAIMLGAFGFAEFKHQKTGNGKRFDQIHQMMKQDK